jgi:hypothetical protein
MRRRQDRHPKLDGRGAGGQEAEQDQRLVERVILDDMTGTEAISTIFLPYGQGRGRPGRGRALPGPGAGLVQRLGRPGRHWRFEVMVPLVALAGELGSAAASIHRAAEEVEAPP